MFIGRESLLQRRCRPVRRLTVDLEANSFKNLITVTGARDSRASLTKQNDTSDRLEFVIVFMWSHIEVMISMLAHSGKTDDLTFNPLLIVHAIDPTKAIIRTSKADHSTNPFNELLNIIETPSIGSPTRNLTLTTNEKIIPSQVSDAFSNECVDHSHCVSNLRDSQIASDINSRLHVVFSLSWTTDTIKVEFVIFQAGPPGSTNPSAVLDATNACFHDF